MAVQDAATLKGYFNTGDTPTEAQFADLIDTVDSKQATLVSATNIKTINSTSLLGSGDIVVGGTDIPVQASAPSNPSDGDLWIDSDATPTNSLVSAINWTLPVAVTDTATLTISKHHVVTVTSADKTLTLPAVSGNAGKLLSIEIAASTTKLITIDGNSSETIDGATTRVMWASETAVLLCDGVTWTKIAGKSIPMVGGIYPSAQTTVNNTTTTIIGCNTTKITPSVAQINDTANNRIVIPRTAPYVVQFNLQYYNNSATGRYYTELGTDGSGTIITVNMIAMTATGEYPPIKGNYVAPFTAGSFLYLYAYQNSGSTQTVHNDIGNTFLTIQEIPAW